MPKQYRDSEGKVRSYVDAFVSGGALELAEDTEVVAVVKGSSLLEQLTEADVVGGALTFSAAVEYVEVYNTDATNAGVFTVNGVAIAVPAATVFGPAKVGTTPAAAVAVTGATTYIVSRYE